MFFKSNQKYLFFSLLLGLFVSGAHAYVPAETAVIRNFPNTVTTIYRGQEGVFTVFRLNPDNNRLSLYEEIPYVLDEELLKKNPELKRWENKPETTAVPIIAGYKILSKYDLANPQWEKWAKEIRKEYDQLTVDDQKHIRAECKAAHKKVKRNLARKMRIRKILKNVLRVSSSVLFFYGLYRWFTR